MTSKAKDQRSTTPVEAKRVMIKAFRAQMPAQISSVEKTNRPLVITKNGHDTVAVVPLRYLEILEILSQFGEGSEIFDPDNKNIPIMDSLRSLFTNSCFLRSYPQQYGQSINNARDLCIVGTTLRRIFPRYKKQLETVVRSGGTIKAVLVDPSKEHAVRYAMMHTFSGHEITADSVRDYSAHIFASYRELVSLRNGSPEGRVKIYKIDNPLSCGIDGIDIRDKMGVIYVRQFQLGTEDCPIFEIKPVDGDWYRFYVDLIDHHINAAAIWK